MCACCVYSVTVPGARARTHPRDKRFFTWASISGSALAPSRNSPKFKCELPEGYAHARTCVCVCLLNGKWDRLMEIARKNGNEYITDVNGV